MGRPAKPTEVKRRLGNPGKRALPDTTVTILPMAAGIPEPPADLQLEGRQLWAQAWDQAITWISMASDGQAVKEACLLADDLAIARGKYRATRDNGDARVVIGLHDQLMRALARIGFDPASRSALGVAEVRKQSDLEKLLAARKTRRRRPATGSEALDA